MTRLLRTRTVSERLLDKVGSERLLAVSVMRICRVSTRVFVAGSAVAGAPLATVALHAGSLPPVVVQVVNLLGSVGSYVVGAKEMHLEPTVSKDSADTFMARSSVRFSHAVSPQGVVDADMVVEFNV